MTKIQLLATLLALFIFAMLEHAVMKIIRNRMFSR